MIVAVGFLNDGEAAFIGGLHPGHRCTKKNSSENASTLLLMLVAVADVSRTEFDLHSQDR